VPRVAAEVTESSPEERIELVRRGHAAYEARDIETVLALLDPVVEIYAPPGVGNPGTYHGHDGFLHWIGHWNEAWEEFRQELLGVESIGERHAVADVMQTARGRASGVELELAASYVYELRGGRLVYMAIYLDGEEARAVAHEREAT
jgi:ketosteroid isomerase-like protein